MRFVVLEPYCRATTALSYTNSVLQILIIRRETHSIRWLNSEHSGCFSTGLMCYAYQKHVYIYTVHIQYSILLLLLLLLIMHACHPPLIHALGEWLQGKGSIKGLFERGEGKDCWALLGAGVFNYI